MYWYTNHKGRKGYFRISKKCILEKKKQIYEKILEGSIK